ncbi:MAG: double zinc ribbon domain-containing protein [Spirochaetaceae bacterium]|nr:double zinc ribbon domain-containing protein [Spirochaetaceae bacterium]
MKHSTVRWGWVFRNWFFPEGCALCGKALRGATEAATGLCGPCEKNLSLSPEPRCSCCGQPLISERTRCLSCRNGPPRFFNRALSLFPYEGRYQKLLGAYKFGGRRNLGNFFVPLLWQGLEILRSREPRLFPDSAGEKEGFGETAWVPVPPRPGKIKKTGWDQVEYLAKLLEAYSPAPGPGARSPLRFRGDSPAIPVCRCLDRLPSEAQKELNREKRRINLRGRMVVKSPPPKTAVLFDDVYTTGSTLDACAQALISGGTKTVYGICLFYD